jgi:hypothetical protein
MNALSERWTDRDILIPNETEQRQMFYIIKKASSWTAWNRILGYYQKWAEVAENSVREADNSGLLASEQSTITYQRYVDILKGLAVFEEGVNRLGKGDKRVFTYNEANAFFARAIKEATYWQTLRYKAKYGDAEWKESTPYGKEFFKVLDGLTGAYSECGRFILENRLLNKPARVSYILWHPVFLPRLPYPDSLPEVMKPKKEVIVSTGELIPYSGIWEPLGEESSRLIGMMNYLHGGINAPTYKKSFIDFGIEEFGYNDDEIINVAWRLIWRDDRYEDGTIPEAEKNYKFVRPALEGMEGAFDVDPLEYIKKHNLPHPFLTGAHRVLNRAEGGEACPREGYWWSPADKEGKTHLFKKGDLLPIFHSREYAETYWLWAGQDEDDDDEEE